MKPYMSIDIFKFDAPMVHVYRSLRLQINIKRLQAHPAVPRCGIRKCGVKRIRLSARARYKCMGPKEPNT